jgi:uncharacterized protein YqjF (DUF2071 family)
MSPARLLRDVAHRPWPLPRGPWVLRQRWLDLLFIHWPVAVADVRRLVPPSLDIQEFGGSSWVGIVAFKIEGLSWRFLPDLPYFSSFPELNLRLYVEAKGKPGVWFVSLDADSAAAVFGARAAFSLPYWRARIVLKREQGRVAFTSARRGHPETAFEIRYAPTGAAAEAAPGTLDHFLTERYCLFTERPGGRLRRLDIHHPPWRLQRADADIGVNTLASSQGVVIGEAARPILHFSRRQDVLAWWPERV